MSDVNEPGQFDDSERDLDSGEDPKLVRRRTKKQNRHRRRVQAISVLPSMFTLGNLIAGFAAIHYASKPLDSVVAGTSGWTALEMAGTLIFLGMFFDAIDGSIARLTRTTSDIGAQLDSLADIVTFGVAPAYMILQLVSKYYLVEGSETVISPDHDDMFGRVFWVIAVIYVCCAALRLARFNVETGVSEALEDHMIFRGLPSPGAAGCLAGLILLHQEYLGRFSDADWMARFTGLGMAGIMLLCALAMVSRLPYVHAANRYFRGQGSFAYVVTLAVILAFAAFYPQEVLAVGFTIYALSAPMRWVWVVWRRRLGAAKRGAADGVV